MQTSCIITPAELEILDGSSAIGQTTATSSWQAAQKDSDLWSESTADDEQETDAPSDEEASEDEEEQVLENNGSTIVTGMPDMCFATDLSADLCITVTGMSDDDKCEYWPMQCSDSITTDLSDMCITVTGMSDADECEYWPSQSSDTYTQDLSELCITVTGMSDEDTCEYWPVQGSDGDESWLTSTKRQLRRHRFWWPAAPSVPADWDSTLFRCGDVNTYMFLGRRLRTESVVDRMYGTRHWRQGLSPVDE